jgi:hypothetical protein
MAAPAPSQWRLGRRISLHLVLWQCRPATPKAAQLEISMFQWAQQDVVSVANFSYQRVTELTAAVLFSCPVGVVRKPAGKFPSGLVM